MAKPKQTLDAWDFRHLVVEKESDAEYGARVFVCTPWSEEHFVVVNVYLDGDGDLIIEVQQ